MKKFFAGMLALALTLVLCACGTNVTSVEPATEEAEPSVEDSDVAAEKELPAEGSDVTTEEEYAGADVQVSIDLAGPWHLDSEKNDLKAFQDIFPAYAEFGASMEIKSDGQISWYIGAEGGSGTYTQDGDILTADIISDVGQKPVTVTFHIVLNDKTVELEMSYNGINVYWVYGDSEEAI